LERGLQAADEQTKKEYLQKAGRLEETIIAVWKKFSIFYYDGSLSFNIERSINSI
jgi:hypothetical protein